MRLDRRKERNQPRNEKTSHHASAMILCVYLKYVTHHDPRTNRKKGSVNSKKNSTASFFASICTQIAIRCVLKVYYRSYLRGQHLHWICICFTLIFTRVIGLTNQQLHMKHQHRTVLWAQVLQKLSLLFWRQLSEQTGLLLGVQFGKQGALFMWRYS